MPTPDHSALLLDPELIAPQLLQALPGMPATPLRGAWLHHSRRRISRKTETQGAPYLTVAYELGFGDPSKGTGERRWCAVKAYSRGASAEAAARGEGRHWPLLDAVVWPLHQDPALAQLPAFIDPAAQAQVVRYEPESHITVRFTPADGSLPVYGKAFCDNRWLAVSQRLQALWPHGEQHADAFSFARPTGHSATLRAVWQAEAVGLPLRSVLDGNEASLWLDRLVRALARLQQVPPLSELRLGLAELLARGHRQADKLARADASLGPALATLMEQLQLFMPTEVALVNVHGDCHVDQMLCAGKRIVLFDLDKLALGHPVHDLADFASQLLTDPGFTTPRRSELACRLVALAHARAAQGLDLDAVDWHLRALLLRKAYSFFVRHRSGWLERVRHALALAARGLQALDAPNQRSLA